MNGSPEGSGTGRFGAQVVMRRTFWKAAGISFSAYAAAVAIGLSVDFRLAWFLFLALQITWTLFCVMRIVQLRMAGAHTSGAESWDRKDYAFALGGLLSSLILLAAVVVITQLV